MGGSATRIGRVPFAYFAFAHFCLASAAVALIVRPDTFVGFFYHPRMTALVHLLTLGWISAAILGALPMVATIALRARLPARRLDVAAAIAFMLGSHGMVSHFWLDAYDGMLWSASLVVFAFVAVGWRAVPVLWRAPIALGVRLGYGLAFANVLLAALLGVAIGLSRSHPILPRPVFESVLGHLHLAAVGWASTIAFGTAYRLLPMVLPSAVPEGLWPVVGSVALEVGTLWLAGTFVFGVPGRPIAGLVLALGIAIFLAQVVWMLRHRRTPARHRPKVDWPRRHAFQAIASLVLATVLGLVLLWAPIDEVGRLRLAPVYGVLGLLGFLGRLVAGMAGYLLPLASWLEAARGRPHDDLPPAPHRRPGRPIQAIAFWAWTIAVPGLAAAFYLEAPMLVAASGAALLVAVLTGGLELLRAARFPTRG